MPVLSVILLEQQLNWKRWESTALQSVGVVTARLGFLRYMQIWAGRVYANRQQPSRDMWRTVGNDEMMDWCPAWSITAEHVGYMPPGSMQTDRQSTLNRIIHDYQGTMHAAV
jgi:hypothetical protein